jgi:vacuolar-type H+-ATPase subunit D/Vma8
MEEVQDQEKVLKDKFDSLIKEYAELIKEYAELKSAATLKV